MRQTPVLPAALALALLATGCSSIKYGSQKIEGGDLSKVKTFCVVVAPQDKVPMDPGLRETLATKIVPAITAHLKEKGYAPAPEESADVLVATHAMIGVADVAAIRWNPTVVTWYPWGPASTGFYATQAVGKEASVVVDIGDARGQRLYWRGWAAGTGEMGATHDPAKMRRLVDNILSGFPRAK